MKNLKYFLGASLIVASAFSALAQASYSGYYLDNYTHRYQLNPAMTDESRKGFVAMPALGNVNVGFQGNLHVSTLIYPVDGKTVLFTSPKIDANTVLKNIHDVNKLGANFDLDILAVGFRAFGGQNVVTLSTVADANVALPGSLFRLMKQGVENQTYEINDVRISATGYAKFQLNHSHEVKQVDGLKVGGAVKFLFGIANVDGYLDQADLTLGTDEWIARTNANVYTNMKNAKYKLKTDDDGKQYVNGVDADGAGLSGFGLGVDLGATYEWRDFRFNLAVLDLGFISWNNTILATTNGTHSINTDNYTFGVESGQADAEWDKMKSDLELLYQLDDAGNVGSRTRSLRTTLNWGVEYTLPYYRKLSFGLVNSTRFNGSFTTTDFRVSANVHPVKCFSASANFAAGTYGMGFGWLANVNVKGFNFFLGMDRVLGKLTKQGVPLNSNGEINFGMNFPF